MQWHTEQDALACLEGTAKYTDEKMWGWLVPIYELGQKGYMNDDLLSLDLYQGGIENFANGNAAMTYVPDSLITGIAAAQLGDKLGMFLWPGIGDSAYKDFVNMSNGGTWTVGKWSKNPEVAGQFIEFTRTAERMKAFYEVTGMCSRVFFRTKEMGGKICWKAMVSQADWCLESTTARSFGRCSRS